MLGIHLVFSTYGFWLPNDPRGSGSENVRAYHLYRIGGDATKVETTHSVAKVPHDADLRQATKAALARPPVKFNGIQARAVVRGFSRIAQKLELLVFACAIMPDHAHLVVGEHRLSGDELLAALKRAATKQLNEEQVHPLKNYPRSNGKLLSPWASGGWKVFLDTADDMHRAIRYVEQNPIKAGLKCQRWSFVVPYS